MRDSKCGSPLLSARNIRCGYHPGHLVLEVTELHICPGELLFILGRSGIGKSTFLELAGLMNLPGAMQDGAIQFRAVDCHYENLLDLWRAGDEEISDFRSRNLSFIFQETNLLDQYSVEENLCLPAWLQGQDYSRIIERVTRYMDRLGMPANLLLKNPNHLSGGQRQRIAFIRALVSDFTVLFGDEPTGNLDLSTAQQLMALLKDSLAGVERCGVIVSHDLRLALAFADRIAVFTPREDQPGTGVLEEGNLYWKSTANWRSVYGQYSDQELLDRLSGLIRMETTTETP